MAITRYNHVDRTSDSPLGGIQTWNRLGNDCEASAATFVAAHHRDGRHADPLVAAGGAYVQWDSGIVRIKRAFGNVRTVVSFSSMTEPRVRLLLAKGAGSMWLAPEVTCIGGAGIPVCQVIGDSISVSIYAADGTGALVQRDFAIVFRHVVAGGHAAFSWDDFVVGDELTPLHVNGIGRYCEAESKGVLREHHPSGAHATAAASVGGAHFVAAAGGYTLTQQHGNISAALTDNGMGDLTVNLASAMEATDTDYFYLPIVQVHGPLVAYVDNLGASSFDVKIVGVTGTADDATFTVDLYGDLATPAAGTGLDAYAHDAVEVAYRVTYQTVNTLGARRDQFYDCFTAEHDADGNHDTPRVARGWGVVGLSLGGTVRLAESAGIVSSITSTTTGRVTVNLSSSMAAPGGAYRYRVKVQPLDRRAITVYPDSLGAASFDIYSAVLGETAADTAFAVSVMGELA